MRKGSGHEKGMKDRNGTEIKKDPGSSQSLLFGQQEFLRHSFFQSFKATCVLTGWNRNLGLHNTAWPHLP